MTNNVWHLLKNEADVEGLMRTFGRFHDSCIRQVLIQTREYVDKKLAMGFDSTTVVQMLFQRQFHNPSAIELRFEEVEDMNWRHDNSTIDSGFTIILEAAFEMKKGLFYWAEDIDWIDAEEKQDFRWLSARIAKWRVVEEGLGKESI